MKREVWVYLETSSEGRLSAGAKELLSQAKTIVRMLPERGIEGSESGAGAAVTSGPGADECAQQEKQGERGDGIPAAAQGKGLRASVADECAQQEKQGERKDGIPAAAQGKGLRGIIAGHSADTLKKAAKEAFLYGAGDVTLICGDELRVFSPESYSDALAQLLNGSPAENPSLILFGRSPNELDLAPSLAARLDVGMISDCVDASHSSGEMIWERHAFGGTVVSSVKYQEEGIQIVSVRPGSFGGRTGAKEEPGVSEESLSGIDFFRYAPTREVVRPTLMEILEAASERGADIGSADVIVAGGNGAGPEGFALIRELAELLHGAVGASRIAVDKGWIPHSNLIGQSGKTVAPSLYINCGISGSVQHIVGMRDAKCVISINKDPRALIFNVSDYGIVGDLHKVLPALIEEIRRSRG